MKFFRKKVGFVAVLLLALSLCGCGNSYVYDFAEEASELYTEESSAEVKQEDAQEEVQAEVQEETDSQEEKVAYFFRNKKLLESHYEKHGIEMGFSSAEEYEAAASDVINNPDALSKTEKEDGDYVFYVEETNEFVVLSTDGYIRTYFLPDAGKSYYDRQ